MSAEAVANFIGLSLAWLGVYLVGRWLDHRRRTRALRAYERDLRQVGEALSAGGADGDTSSGANLILRAERRLRRGLGADHSEDAGFGVGGCASLLSGLAVVAGLAASAIVMATPSGAAVGAAAVPVMLGSLAVWFGEMNRTDAQARIDRMRSGYALYFRPFTFDLTTTVRTHFIWRGASSRKNVRIALEEIIGGICMRAGLGLRSIGRVKGQVGPSAVVSSDEQWRDKAERLLHRAALVIVIPGSSPGSMWELGEIRARRLLDRTVWIMPAASILDDHLQFEEAWRATASACSSHLRLSLPDYDPRGTIFCFGRSGSEPEIRPFSQALLASLIDLSRADTQTETTVRNHRATPLPNWAWVALLTLLAVAVGVAVFFVAAAHLTLTPEQPSGW